MSDFELEPKMHATCFYCLCLSIVSWNN